MNNLTDLWIGVLQGQPIFLFQPAHITSHPRYNQHSGDVEASAVNKTAEVNATKTMIDRVEAQYYFKPNRLWVSAHAGVDGQC